MSDNYFFIDGSALTAQIRQLQRAEPAFRNKRLCLNGFRAYLMTALEVLHDGQCKRMTFYFPQGDTTAVESYLIVPSRKTPGAIRDLHIKYCGYKLKRSADFEKFVDECVPPKFRDRFSKSEKGLDIEMCCDALRLAYISKIDRLFILSNDSDFIPFCRTMKDFGANVSIIHLSEHVAPNLDLLQEVDSYDVVPTFKLRKIFFPLQDAAEAAPSSTERTGESLLSTLPITEGMDVAASEKPDAEPSALGEVKETDVEGDE